MSTTLDLIKSSLRAINSYQSGEQIAQADQQDCLDCLWGLLDSLSTQKQFIYGSQEFVLQWISGQIQYKLGNPLCTDIGEPAFTGTVTGGSNVITGVTNIPADLVAGTAASGVGAGSALTDLGNVFPAGAYVTAFNAGAHTVTMNANASATPSVNPDQITYTIPGDFAIPRPLRITHGYTRFSQLDFSLDVYTTESEYNSILYKYQPGPWPTLAWYNNQFPYGLLNVYQVPGNNAELHLFCDTILATPAINATVILPQGYKRALKWLLARELWPEYWGMKPFPPHMAKLAAEAAGAVKSLNAQPVPKMTYETILTKRRHDKGFIFRGF